MVSRANDRDPEYIGRLAPSPTGGMHLGIARTFLAAWLDARKAEGQLLLRIEDIDQPRCRPGAEDGILRDLEWLGLSWDARTPRQSEREARYLDVLDALGSMGRTYRCTCSRKEIAIASAPHPGEEGPRYPGTCREAYRERAGRSPSMRLRTEADDQIEFVDALFGPHSENVFDRVGDFVIRRSDRLWAYQLAVSVDDLDQGVTRIVRGADLRSSTARQLLIRRLLAPDAPKLDTLHIPLVLDDAAKRLSTRDGAPQIEALRSSGEASERIIGRLAHSLGLVDENVSARPDELVELWAPTRVPKKPVRLE